jgi:hypothetical protein
MRGFDLQGERNAWAICEVLGVTQGIGAQKKCEQKNALKNRERAFPRSSPSAFRSARVALKLVGEDSFSDNELDRLLPPALKKKGP